MVFLNFDDKLRAVAKVPFLNSQPMILRSPSLNVQFMFQHDSRISKFIVLHAEHTYATANAS